MELVEDIILLVGGSASAGSKKPEEVKKAESQLKVGIRKLLNKSTESVKKGIEIVKNVTARLPELNNTRFINNTLMNYIRENPVKSAGYVTATSLLASAGIWTYQTAKALIQRYNQADERAYAVIKRGYLRPNSTPFLDYIYLLNHFFWHPRAATNRLGDTIRYDYKTIKKVGLPHGNPLPPKVEQTVPHSPFNWRFLPLTLLSGGVLGYAAAKAGSYARLKEQANNNYWNAYLKSNDKFLTDSERAQAHNSIIY